MMPLFLLLAILGATIGGLHMFTGIRVVGIVMVMPQH